MTRPGRFLITSWDGGGNTPSALNLGARLIHLGHRVRLMGWDSMAARAAAAGLEFACYPSVPPPPKDQPLDDDWEALSKVVLHGHGAREDILAQAKEFEPDVLVVDCMMGAGFDAAGILGLPTGVLVHVMYGPFRYEWGAMMLGMGRWFGPGFGGCCACANSSRIGHAVRPAAQHDVRGSHLKPDVTRGRCTRTLPRCSSSRVTRGCSSA